MRLIKWICAAFCALSVSVQAAPLITPVEHQRPADQTFLTAPEWFLVFSPEEYATSLRPATRRPSQFPFAAHIGQFWTAYRDISGECQPLPENAGYHVMINVIGVSTTAEYALKGLYEGIIGRFTELVANDADTPEDRIGARVAQDYVDFIKVRPWYEFDFVTPIRAIWSSPVVSEGNLLRKWERRYMLTSEFAVKAAYAKLIEFGTRSSYAVPIEKTYVIVRPRPDQPTKSLPSNISVIASNEKSMLLDLPRLQGFTGAATTVAAAGYDFETIAGNGGEVLVTLVGPDALPVKGREIYRQPILTRKGEWRYAVAYPITSLGNVLRANNGSKVKIEHVYDF